MSKQIAKLPIRTYTTIRDYEYNEKVEDDIIESADLMNIDTSSLASVSPVVCQMNEPHESLRTVPWAKPTTEEETDDIPKRPDILLYRNGRWVSAIPEFEGLVDDKDYLEGVRDEIIQPENAQSFENKQEAYDNKAKVEGDLNFVKGKKLDLYNKWLKAMQLAFVENTLVGNEVTAIGKDNIYEVAPGAEYEPKRDPNHIVSFVHRDEPDTYTEDFTSPHSSSVYRAYCHPMFLVGAGFNDFTDWEMKELAPEYGGLSYRARFKRWNALRAKLLPYLERKAAMLSEDDEYDWMYKMQNAINYPVYYPNEFAKHFGFVSNPAPFIAINITKVDVTSGIEVAFPDGEGDPEPDADIPDAERLLVPNVFPVSQATNSDIISVVAVNPNSFSTIRYTLDHTVPVESSEILPPEGITINVPGRIRLRAFSNNGTFPPSRTVTRMFYKFDNKDLPDIITPYVHVWHDENDPDTVLGFFVWFSHINPITNQASSKEIQIEWTWTAYGKRKTPPELWRAT